MLEQDDFDRIESLIERHETKACASVARACWKRRTACIVAVCVISYGSHYVLESRMLEGAAHSIEIGCETLIAWGFSRAREM